MKANFSDPSQELLTRIREDKDHEALLALFNEDCFQHFATAIGPFASTAEMLRWLGSLGAHKIEMVAEWNGVCAGFLGLYILPDRQNHIGWFCIGVREAFQRRGIASVLLSGLVAMADGALGLERLQLTVYADNEAAIRLYRKFGFEIEGRHPRFLRRGRAFVDGFTMARLRNQAASALPSAAPSTNF